MYELTHVGLIPDGNRRWALENEIPYLAAYGRSMEVLTSSIDLLCSEIPDLRSLVVYMMSRRNLQRGREDLEAVLLAESVFCRTQVPALCRRWDMAVTPVGVDRVAAYVNPDVGTSTVRDSLSAVMVAGEASARQASRSLYLLYGYDPFDELNKAHLENPGRKITLEMLTVPVQLDLVIRTSGTIRISDFVPLQSGYAELVFIDKWFQDLADEDLRSALAEYGRRTRTFGS